MEQGIVIGPESAQKSVDDFNMRVNHIGIDGEVKNLPENSKEANSVFENNILSIKQNGNDFFSERKSIDSISFVLFAINIDDIKRIGLTYDYIPGINKSIIKAYTSSVKEEYNSDLRLQVIEEVRNQAGFVVDLSHVEYLGKCLVSTKSSEFCHLFGVAVDKVRNIKTNQSNRLKLDSGQYWTTNEDVKDLEDWRAQTILMKRYLNKKNLLIIKNKSDEK